jgi:hypothetical protein
MSGARFSSMMACVACLMAGGAPASALASPARVVAHDSIPTVTLTSPASGGLVTGGQPFFGGTAGTDATDASTVSIQVFAGGSASGVPVQVLGAMVSGGNYSTGPTTPLPDGLYTAQASQGSSVGVGTSAAVSFRIYNAAPALTLAAPAAEPLLTGAPTLTGTASTAAGASSTVTLVAYPGASSNATPVGSYGGAVSAQGAFSIQVSPALADGQYTLVASQTLAGGGSGFSAPVTVEVKTAPPALTITGPTAGASVAQDAVSFGGAAGDGYGDVGEVDLTLYRGSSTAGRALGTQAVTPDGGSWESGWAAELALGIYTVRAQQHDIAGRVTTVTRTFIVVPTPAVIGQAVQISQSGVVTVPIGCPASTGSCAGAVLIVSRRLFRTHRGGPRGHLRVLFAAFTVPAGTDRVISRPLPASSFRVLRGKGRQPVTVTVVLSADGGSRQVFGATRLAKVGS